MVSSPQLLLLLLGGVHALRLGPNAPVRTAVARVAASPSMMASKAVTSKVFFDVSIGGKPAGRVTFNLWGEATPKTAENFRALCTGEKGVGVSGKPLHYRGCAFHRIIPNFMCQGGDFTDANGMGGESIYGRTFDDENFDLSHTAAGLLSMANAGPNTNGSQFFITTVPAPFLDGKHVVFGEVDDGFETLGVMEAMGSKSGSTKAAVVIEDCGELPL